MNSSRWLLLCVLATCCVVVACGQAGATTFHVSPQGSNTPPYDSYATAAREIADALLAGGGYGDTVLIQAGYYRVDTTLMLPAGLVIAGVGRDSVTVNLGPPDWYPETNLMFDVDQDNEFYGVEFSFSFGSDHDPNIFFVSVYGPDTLVIHDCRFREIAVSASGPRHAFIYNNEFQCGSISAIRLAMQNAWVHHNRFIGKTGAVGVQAHFAGDVLIEHNVFEEDPIGRPTAVMALSSTYVVVRNNIMLRTRAPAYWYHSSGIFENNTVVTTSGFQGNPPSIRGTFAYLPKHKSLLIRNNVFVDMAGYFYFGTECDTCRTGPITYVHNAFWPPQSEFYRIVPDVDPSRVNITDSANFSAFPMFVDDSLHLLQAGSPLIDAGDPTVLDVDGSPSDIGWTGGPGGFTYEYEDLPPRPPDSLSLTGDSTVVKLSWTPRFEADLAGYRLYRDTRPAIWPQGDEPLREVTAGELTWTDTIPDSLFTVYYVVTAFDSGWQESGTSPEVRHAVREGGNGISTRPRILRAYPNPTGSSVTIEVHIPDVGTPPTSVTVTVFNILGSPVREIHADTPQPGRHWIRWDCTTSDGQRLASGVYVVRIRIPGHAAGDSIKLVLLK